MKWNQVICVSLVCLVLKWIKWHVGILFEIEKFTRYFDRSPLEDCPNFDCWDRLKHKLTYLTWEVLQNKKYSVHNIY